MEGYIPQMFYVSWDDGTSLPCFVIALKWELSLWFSFSVLADSFSLGTVSALLDTGFPCGLSFVFYFSIVIFLNSGIGHFLECYIPLGGFFSVSLGGPYLVLCLNLEGEGGWRLYFRFSLSHEGFEIFFTDLIHREGSSLGLYLSSVGKTL